MYQNQNISMQIRFYGVFPAYINFNIYKRLGTKRSSINQQCWALLNISLSMCAANEGINICRNDIDFVIDINFLADRKKSYRYIFFIDIYWFNIDKLLSTPM